MADIDQYVLRASKAYWTNKAWVAYDVVIRLWPRWHPLADPLNSGFPLLSLSTQQPLLSLFLSVQSPSIFPIFGPLSHPVCPRLVRHQPASSSLSLPCVSIFHPAPVPPLFFAISSVTQLSTPPKPQLISQYGYQLVFPSSSLLGPLLQWTIISTAAD